MDEPYGSNYSRARSVLPLSGLQDSQVPDATAQWLRWFVSGRELMRVVGEGSGQVALASWLQGCGGALSRISAKRITI